MEIEVGEYVRTKNGEIAIFKGWNNNSKSQWSCKLEFQKIKTLKYCSEEYIKSHSPEIIDLIEDGDLIKYNSNNYGTDIIEVVNETCTVKEDYDNGEGFVCTALDNCIRTKDIKSIATHEQFEEMEYEL